ncbi:MAG: hypothetical protein CMG00_04140 [Candidatus Marinimicrobia bacterium]|nr:hypothetical protein [Candidatus Neomarinimicrobiota bacterium]
MRLEYFLWMIYLIVFPFYYFSQGNPQFSDFFAVFLFILSFNIILTQINKENYINVLFVFVIYTFFINSIWFMITGELNNMRFPLYYIYSFMFILFLNAKKHDYKFWNTTYNSLSVSIIIQILIYLFYFVGISIRTKLFFNNPNQLALWGICLLILFYIMSKILNKSFRETTFYMFLISVLIMISNSMAGIGAMVLFWLFYFINNKVSVFKYVILLFMVLFFCYSYTDFVFRDIYLIENIYTRIETDNQNDNTFSGRGLDRIFNDYRYLIFGAGEGRSKDFNSIYKGEIHSTLPAILFSYGFIGFLIYIYSIYIILKSKNKEAIGLFLVLFVFSFAHMNLRIPLFWVSLFTIYLLSKYNLGKT